MVGFSLLIYFRNGLLDFFSPGVLQSILQEDIPNPQLKIWLISTSMSVLRYERGLAYDKLCLIISTRIIPFTRENPNFETVSAVCKFLLNFHECIPKGDYTSGFCVSLIHTIATFIPPKTSTEMHTYIKEVTYVIGGLLHHIWQNADNECIMQCLKAIFSIISYVDEKDLDPSVALGGVIQHIPTRYVDQVTKTTVADTSIPDRNMAAALGRMIDWISWPLAKTVEVWVIAFLRGLAAVHKYTILIDVTEEKAEQVCLLVSKF